MYLELVMPGQSGNACQWHVAQSSLLNMFPGAPGSTWVLAADLSPCWIWRQVHPNNSTEKSQSWICLRVFVLTDVLF